MDGFSGGVASRVADDFDACAEAVDGVAYEHDVLVPAHELAFAGRAADDDALSAVLDLDVDEVVVGFEVESPVGEVRRFDGCDES